MYRIIIHVTFEPSDVTVMVRYVWQDVTWNGTVAACVMNRGLMVFRAVRV
jgi:hypothetical protein